MGDDLRGQGVVFVHEAEVGLEGGRRVGGGFGRLEHAGRVRGQVGRDGGRQGVEGGRVRGVDGDDDAARFEGPRGGRGCQGRGDFGEEADLPQHGEGEDHGFEGLGLRVDAHVVVVVTVAIAVAAGLGVL